MPASRAPHDPFTESAPLRTTTSTTTSLRAQTSQHSLRSNTSTTSSRTRQARDRIASTLSRRGTTPRFEDEVFADTDSEQDLTAAARRQRPARRTGRGSPEGKFGRGGSKSKLLEEERERDFLNRQPDGSYLLGVAGFGGDGMPVVNQPKTEEELNEEEADAHYGAMARHFFVSGPAAGTSKYTKKHEEEWEQYRAPMMMRLRERVVQELEDERWRYEAS